MDSDTPGTSTGQRVRQFKRMHCEVKLRNLFIMKRVIVPGVFISTPLTIFRGQVMCLRSVVWS